MTTKYKDFTLEIINAAGYDPNSSDNLLKYAKVYADESELRPTGTLGIRISRNGVEQTSVVICEPGLAGLHDQSFVIQENDLFICWSDKIYSIGLPDLKLNWKNRFDTATCFGIYSFNRDFIIHGELEVKRIDTKGNIKWDFSAKDIFATQDGSDALIIKDNKIELTDWDGNKYVLDENGRLMK